ncbi:3D domain-containing protein [Alicyclobacillus mengziensis]|uniref:3D domain-containing protein n=2 Tax=Alicyclobacillus mengziensis TaxID=2931921 RepID=A0A9X7W362_9BACL|nr:3D domain-containing protein [Alicyclobacillus mengziensis]
MALVALLCLMAPASSLPPAPVQAKVIHPEIVKRQHMMTFQSDFLSIDKFRAFTAHEHAPPTVKNVHSLSRPSKTSRPSEKNRRSERPVSKPKVSASQWMAMTATWYDAYEGINGTGNGITASGAPVQTGVTIAVDPNVIPLGSIVEVKFPDGTDHMYKAEDVGGAIKGNRIDIYDPSPQYCYQHGIQHVMVRIWYAQARGKAA